MRTSRRMLALTCTIAAAVATGALAAATSPPARAQSAQAGSTGDTGSSSCPASNPPNELVLGAGTPQTAQLDTGFANPLQVELANTNGCPITTTVTGTAVTFTAPASGPSATFDASGSSTLTVGADASGSASVQMLTADDTPGSYTVTASSAYGSVSFSLTNTAAGIPATITPLAPTSQHATVNGRYSQPLAVRVLDARGTPVVGATVTFSLASAAGAGAGGGSAASAGANFDDGTTQAMETSNADGVASSPAFSANATSGAFTATATVGHVTEPARFALDNVAARPHTITAVGSSGRTATVATHYSRRLRVAVRDAAGQPVAGVTVTFTLGSASATGASAGSGGAGATFTSGATQATETTGTHGIATSPRLAANDEAGSFTATASTTGASGLALFHLHNHAGAPSTVTAGVGAGQSTATAMRFEIPLAVTVTDAHGNKAPGARVRFTAPSSGPGGSFPDGRTTVTVRTNSSGIAIAPPFTANSQAGGYIVTAAVKGVRPVAFALVNTAA
jgi:protocatechuate 3,4-dioxygenase beta subunit